MWGGRRGKDEGGMKGIGSVGNNDVSSPGVVGDDVGSGSVGDELGEEFRYP